MYNMNKFLILLNLIFLFHFSCTDHKNINTEHDLALCKKEVMFNYDLTSYIKLSNHYNTENNFQDFIPYTIRMMDSLDIAHYDFFNSYLGIKSSKDYKIDDFFKLEKPERDFLLYILQKGAKAGDDYCREKLIGFYSEGIGLPKNVIKADSLKKELGKYINKY